LATGLLLFLLSSFGLLHKLQLNPAELENRFALLGFVNAVRQFICRAPGSAGLWHAQFLFVFLFPYSLVLIHFDS
jgi:hypothetical protein